MFIRPPRPSDQAVFLAAVRRSQTLHRPWVFPPDTAALFRKGLARWKLPSNRCFFIWHSPRELVGVVNISEIVRGAFCSAYVGYYAFEPFAGRGFMTAGLRLVIDHLFGKMKLHRLEANIQPGNRRSIRLAKRLGFRKEGYSPRYLKIAGRWRDHERWALLADAGTTLLCGFHGRKKRQRFQLTSLKTRFVSLRFRSGSST
jgi:ribosomal-protein-alanine N-acetyltransferase